ncbi:uncharacterized protein LOC117179116 [Belonocnema kinseyi]|uniref:uncharacterized protein LOC117179116 n=1 Tax=Belonocnema kinseyi TaxID=2817044 RepID=UPI00143DDC78|nr:uncharacterized protein LOC117179116 [Belonocnema kinseyi]
MEDPTTGRFILGELKPKSVLYSKFAKSLPTDGKMIIPRPTVCKRCKLLLTDRKSKHVVREYLIDDYAYGIQFSTECPKCYHKVFFTINPMNTNCRIQDPVTEEYISLELKEDNY